MKHLLLILSLFASIVIESNGQYVPTQADLDKFYKTKTLIVLDDNPMREYNMVIKDIIKKEWDLTKYEFIPFNEFEKKRLDPQYSFLVVTLVNFEKDNTKANYRFLQLLIGGDYLRVNQMPELVSVPISYAGVDEDSYVYKLSAIVRLTISHLKLITAKPDLMSSNMFKYYRDNIDSIKDKTLYVTKEDLTKSVNSEARIKKIYPYSFKIVSREQVQDAIENRNPNVVFMHKVGPEGTKLTARCYKVIIGADNPKLYYFDYHLISSKKPDGLLKSDFNNLAKGKSIIPF